MFDRNAHLITHAGCLDGSAAAILFTTAGGDPRNVRYVSPSEVDETIWSNDVYDNFGIQLILVDVSPNSDDMAAWLTGRGNAIVIDHHKTAARFENLKGFFISSSNLACGSEIFRMWLVNQKFPEFNETHWRNFLRVIDDHDRWINEEPLSKELPLIFSLWGQKRFVQDFGENIEERFSSGTRDCWSQYERRLVIELKEYQDKRFKSLLGSFRRHGDVGVVISDEVNCSELLHQALERNPDFKIACQISIGLNKVSLRSRPGTDVSEIAQRHGGGGHAQAAGFPLPDGLVNTVIEKVLT